MPENPQLDEGDAAGIGTAASSTLGANPT